MTAHRDQTVRWGEVIELAPDISQQASGDLVRVILPRPVLCRLNLHAEVMDPPDDNPLLQCTGLIFTYDAATGSASATVRRVFRELPASGDATSGLGNVPLDAEWYVPLNRIYARVAVRGTARVRVNMWLTPLNLQPGEQ
jgi:hypothetical protein